MKYLQPSKKGKRDSDMQKTALTQASKRRERQVLRKKGEILDAATRVFAAKGFSSATTKDIANEADIGESTLYNYFDSKREIMLAILDEYKKLFDADFQEATALPSREAFVELVDRTIDLFTSRVFFMRTLIAEAWIDNDILENYASVRLRQISGILQDFFSKEIKAGIFKPIDPQLAARFAMGMFFSIVIPVVRGVEPAPAPEARRSLAEAMVTVLIEGIHSHNGINHDD
jgi:AcrR family transcriptional regulator